MRRRRQFAAVPSSPVLLAGEYDSTSCIPAHLSIMEQARLAAVAPNFGAVNGSGDLRSIVGALLTYGLIIAVLMLIVCSATWALASHSGSWHTAQKAKLGCFVALGGATLTGAALTWANWLLDLGAHL